MALCFSDFLDYYFQALGYIATRKERRARFDQDTRSRNVLPGTAEYAAEFKSYCGRERVVLRRRRTKLKVDQFHIIAQVGQGGYGEVFLARKQVRGRVSLCPIIAHRGYDLGIGGGVRVEEDEKENIVQNGRGSICSLDHVSEL